MTRSTNMVWDGTLDANGMPNFVPALGFENAPVVVTTNGTGKPTKNRNQNLATTHAEATNTFVFTESDNVRYVGLAFYDAITGEPVQDDTLVLVLVDGLNEAAETSMFADTGGQAVDVEYFMVYASKVTHLYFAGWLERLALLPLSKPLRCVALCN